MWHVGVEQRIKVNNKFYKLARLTRRLIRAWYDYAFTIIPHPLKSLLDALPFLPTELLDKLVDHADDLALARRNLDSPQFLKLWSSDDGVFKIFSLLISEHHPELDEDEILEIFRQVPDIEALIAKASGQIPTDDLEVVFKFLRGVGLLPALEGSQAKYEMDWADFDRQLFRNNYLTPQQVDEMTMSEIFVVSTEKSSREMSYPDALAFREAYLKLTPQQKLQVAIRKYPL